jgi:GT2 family glycosyltransferase
MIGIYAMNKKVPKVSVTISSYNRKKDLIECLRSIKENDYPNLEIIIVDNGCTDGTAKTVKATFPEVKVVRAEKNLGVSGGKNLAIKNAPKDSDYLFLLDDDYILKKNAISELVKAIHGKKEYGAATAKVLYFENPQIVQLAGSKVGLFTGINYIRSGPDGEEFSKFVDTEGIGGTGLVKMEVIEKVGLYDGSYHYYYEDADLGIRIIRTGYKILFVPTSKILHKLPLSEEKGKQRWFARAYWVTRNKIIFMRKYSKCFPLFVLFYPAWLSLYTFQAIRYFDPVALLNFYKGAIAGFRWALFDYSREALWRD